MADSNRYLNRSMRAGGTGTDQGLQYSRVLGLVNVRDVEQTTSPSQSPPHTFPAGHVTSSLISSFSDLNLSSSSSSAAAAAAAASSLSAAAASLNPQPWRQSSTHHQPSYFDGGVSDLFDGLLMEDWWSIPPTAPQRNPFENPQNQQNPYGMNPQRYIAENHQYDQPLLDNNNDLQSIYRMLESCNTQLFNSNSNFDFGRLGNYFDVQNVVGHNNSFSHGHRQYGRPVPDITFVPLSDLRGNIMFYAKHQQMSRVLQNKLLPPNKENIEMVVSDIIDHLEDLMTNQYGNYFFQRLLEVCNACRIEDLQSIEVQKRRIIRRLCSNPFELVSICQNIHGSRSVQKLLQCIILEPENISLIISALALDTLDLATDPQGYHVLQHCFRLFSNSEHSEKLTMVMAKPENCFTIATNKSGCVVLHTCMLENVGPSQGYLLAEIIAQALHLAEDPYGNYVIQYALELSIRQVNERILRQLKGNFFTFSRSKFASNVVEKCMTMTDPDHSEKVINELISNPNISLLLVDPFGNYVIQSAFEASKGIVRERLINLIRHNLPILRSNQFGRKVLKMLKDNGVRFN